MYLVRCDAKGCGKEISANGARMPDIRFDVMIGTESYEQGSLHACSADCAEKVIEAGFDSYREKTYPLVREGLKRAEAWYRAAAATGKRPVGG